MSETILTEIDNGLGIITLNRPERLNAFDDVLIRDLSEALVKMDTDSDVRVVVLSSTGKSFCAGADLNWIRGHFIHHNKASYLVVPNLYSCDPGFNDMKKPTVARVQGPAYGGGVGLIAACDIAIGSVEATFCLSEVRLGIVPAMISPYVLPSIGERAARRYVQTAEVFDAREAHRIGLLHEVVESSALDERIAKLLKQLKSAAPGARSVAKKLAGDVVGRPIDEALVTETSTLIADMRARPEAREGLSAFLEKRKPSWS